MSKDDFQFPFADTCDGTGYVCIDGCDVACQGCTDCDFDFGPYEEPDLPPF